MPATIFATNLCGLPLMASIADRHLVDDCSVPPAPPAIFDCPDVMLTIEPLCPGPPGPPGPTGPSNTLGVYPVVFPTGIPAASSLGVPGIATDVILVVPAGNGFTVVGTPPPITAYNPYRSPITGSGKFGYVKLRADGKYHLLIGDC